MYSSSFYKHGAWSRLKGRYLPMFLAAVIAMLPTYIISQISAVLDRVMPDAAAIGILVAVALQIFVIGIFDIGFIRFLLRSDTAENGELKNYDFNLLLSGYTNNFKNTLKITVLRELKLVAWAVVAFIPMIAAIVFIAVSVTDEGALYLYNAVYNVLINPTVESMTELNSFLDMSLPYLGIFSTVYLVLTVIASVPLIRKSYEYQMIPMIVADDADMPCKSAFKRTRDIMTGFRLRYFFIQFSFIMYNAIIVLLAFITNSPLVICVATAALMPYQYMTYLEFYRQRNEVIEHNISTYGQQEL